MATSTRLDCIDDIAYLAEAGDRAFSIRQTALKQASAITTEATEWGVVYAATMLWQRFTNSAIADIRQSLADRQVKMAEAALAQAQLVWAEEKAFVDATMNAAAPTTDYSYVTDSGTYADKNTSAAVGAYEATIAKKGIAFDVCDETRIGRGAAVGKIDLMAHAMRSAESRYLQLDDRRYSRQYAVLGMGKGILRDAMSMGELSEGHNAVRKTILGAINSSLTAWGYGENTWSRTEKWSTQTYRPPIVVGGNRGLWSASSYAPSGTASPTLSVEVSPTQASEGG